MSTLSTSAGTTAVGLTIGYLADRLLGDPQRWHPVAGFGQLAMAAEHLLYKDSARSGAVLTAGLVGGAAGLGALINLVTPGRVTRTTAVAVATWTVLGGRSLAVECAAVASRLEHADLDGARARISRLVGRDPETLDADGIARAAVESMAENTSDAVVAPLLWGAVSGIPGLLAYRAVNTLDAMIGHRSTRYDNFGRPAARLDDVANFVPARLAAALAAIAAPTVGGRPAASMKMRRRDADRHPSPNGGQVEAAFAGALGIRLGGVNTYDGRTEDRGTLGDGPPPGARDIRRATRLAAWVSAGALAVGIGVRLGADGLARLGCR